MSESAPEEEPVEESYETPAKKSKKKRVSTVDGDGDGAEGENGVQTNGIDGHTAVSTGKHKKKKARAE